MRILVTGGAGFVGSHLCDRLVADGHAVVVVDDLSLGRRDNIAHLLEREQVRLHVVSILDPVFDDIVASGRFDAVFHLAANSDIQAGSRDRRVDLQRTFLTTFEVCESMARHGVGQLLFASTSAVYGDVDVPVHEDFGPLTPISFYGAAKLASEAFISAFSDRAGIRTWVFRFPNVIGGRATHGVIFDFINKLRADPNVLDVLGNGTQEKPYLHVDDLILGMLAVWRGVEPAPVSVFNLGATTSTSVRSIAEIVVEEMGLIDTAEIRYGETDRGWPGDVPRFQYDLSRVHALGWKPTRTSDEAVCETVQTLLAEGV